MVYAYVYFTLVEINDLFFLQANAFRNAHKIYVNGSDVPDAVASFVDLYEHYNLPSYLRRNVASTGYLQPTPIQMQAIPLMLHVSQYHQEKHTHIYHHRLRHNKYMPCSWLLDFCSSVAEIALSVVSLGF